MSSYLLLIFKRNLGLTVNCGQSGIPDNRYNFPYHCTLTEENLH